MELKGIKIIIKKKRRGRDNVWDAVRTLHVLLFCTRHGVCPFQEDRRLEDSPKRGKEAGCLGTDWVIYLKAWVHSLERQTRDPWEQFFALPVGEEWAGDRRVPLKNQPTRHRLRSQVPPAWRASCGSSCVLCAAGGTAQWGVETCTQRKRYLGNGNHSGRRKCK